MFKSLFRSRRNPNIVIVEALYGQIVAAARAPAFYAGWNVPDTPLGRFEMMTLHMVLFMRRTRGETGALADIAQEMTDEFFKDVDHSLRELGIGDIGVPKRMKKLARMFYGRAESYTRAIDAEDRQGLAQALARNIFPGEPEDGRLAGLADHVIASGEALARQPTERLLAGEIHFPAPGEQGAQDDRS